MKTPEPEQNQRLGFEVEPNQQALTFFKCNNIAFSLYKLACPTGWYGANCDRECHCSSSKCNPALGCIDTDECEADYSENYCQGIL